MDVQKKKSVAQDWLNAFPNLASYSHDKLYEIVGAFICGIELIKLPRVENYRPHFVIYPLYKEGVDRCLRTPLLMSEFYNLKGNQINLPYDDINARYKTAHEIVKSTSKLNLGISSYRVSDFFDCADHFLFSHHDPWYKRHSGKRAQLFELKFYTALYSNKQAELISIVNQIKKESENWNMQMFESWYGKFDLWYQALGEMCEKRSQFLMQIEQNKVDKKIAFLNVFDLN